MNILVSGASGFIGSAVVAHLRSRGHSVVRLSRRAATDTVVWDIAAGRIAPLPSTLDAVVHLAGENIFGRWTQAKKNRIYSSRVGGTRLLAEHLAALSCTPKVMICASGVGFYGHRGDVVLTEAEPPGDGFLSDVCRDWEQAAQPAQQAGIRVVCLRLGMVLDSHGGALAKMLPAFRMGLGGPVGDGRQWVSWIALNDVVRVVACALENDMLIGPVNTVAPEPVQNRSFAQTLAAAVHRPAVLPAPALLLRLMLGQFADETLLAGTRAIPDVLLKAGFDFQSPTLAAALSNLSIAAR